jgi:large subunit ribosomal protein L22
MAAVSATLRNCRVSARKARLVADQIRGKQVEEALTLLSLSNKRIARPMRKLVKSALGNADVKNDREKAGIDVDNLFVTRVFVDEGASLWRIRSRAQGRANWIQRRTSHITVELEER